MDEEVGMRTGVGCRRRPGLAAAANAPPSHRPSHPAPRTTPPPHFPLPRCPPPAAVAGTSVTWPPPLCKRSSKNSTRGHPAPCKPSGSSSPRTPSGTRGSLAHQTTARQNGGAASDYDTGLGRPRALRPKLGAGAAKGGGVPFFHATCSRRRLPYGGGLSRAGRCRRLGFESTCSNGTPTCILHRPRHFSCGADSRNETRARGRSARCGGHEHARHVVAALLLLRVLLLLLDRAVGLRVEAVRLIREVLLPGKPRLVRFRLGIGLGSGLGLGLGLGLRVGVGG